ncbi:MAG: hypothetical protein IKQ97_10865 [Eubacterium sp.]|nr:hypothetical protein [Eubacterium sp.]
MNSEFQIKHVNDDENGLELAIIGRIDASNFEDFFNAIRSERDAHPQGVLTLDAGEMYYISSAGLRSILAIVKDETEMICVSNLEADLFELFDDAGFTDIMNVTSKEDA